jgi:hypothetical protein
LLNEAPRPLVCFNREEGSTGWIRCRRRDANPYEAALTGF